MCVYRWVKGPDYGVNVWIKSFGYVEGTYSGPQSEVRFLFFSLGIYRGD